jgi:hypothetical protein
MNTNIPQEAATRLWAKTEQDLKELLRLRKVALSLQNDKSSSSFDGGRSAGTHSDPTAQAAVRNLTSGSLKQSVRYADGYSLEIHDLVDRLISTIGNSINRWEES